MEKTVKPFNILVADDEESLRSIIAEVLTDQGYTVDTATNGKQALEKVRTGKFHVVVTDIRMPEMTGIELLEQIKKFDKNIEVVIMTSFASIDTAIKAIRLGAYDYLTKPFEDLNIIPTVIDRTVGKLMLELEVKKLLAALKKKNEEIHALYTQTTQLFNTLKFDEIVHLSVQALTELSGATDVVYYNMEAQHGKLTAAARHAKDVTATSILPQEVAFTAPELQELAKQARQPSAAFRRKVFGDAPEQACLLLPLLAEQRLYGYFALAAGTQPFAEEARELILQYIGNATMQAEKARLHATIEQLAVRDGLTDLHNRRYFQDTLRAEFERARRFNKQLSLVLFDVDHFKHYNDTNGHPAGDALLREVAKLFRTTSRTIDITARYGGEEFVAILLETNKEGASIRAENFRKAVENHNFTHGDKQPLGKLTVSGGYAEFPTDAATWEELIEAADQGLYLSKKSGRNQMHAAPPPDQRVKK